MDSTTSTVNTGILPEQIGFNLRTAYNLVTLFFADTFEDLALSPIQFAMMEVILNNDHLSQREIADHIGSQPSVLVKPLRELEERGLVVRERLVEDRRQYSVRLTAEGRTMQSIARKKIQEVERNLAEPLSGAERAELLGLLKKLNRR